MKPTDALRLPRARLTDDQRKSIAKAIEMLEVLFEQHMQRWGISVDMQCDDPIVLHELERYCKSDGWTTQIAPDWVPPRIRGGAPTMKGFKMLLIPPQSAYDEVDKENRQ